MLSNEKKPRGLQGLSPSLIKIYSSAMDQLEQSRRKNKGGASSALVISKERPKLRKDKLVINDPILLHEQFIEVKKEQNTTKNENRVLKTRISVLEKEISKQNKAMEEIYTTQDHQWEPNYGSSYRKNSQIDNYMSLKAYKETILAQSRQIKALESEMQQTRQSLRYTKLVEYEMEVKTYFQEAMRLKRLLKHKEMGVEAVHESSETLLRYDKIVEQLTEKLGVSENQIKMTEELLTSKTEELKKQKLLQAALTKQVEHHKVLYKECNESFELKKKECEGLKGRFKSSQEAGKELQEQINQLEKENNELNEQIESMEEKNQMYKKDRDDIKEKMESMKMQLSIKSKQIEINSLESSQELNNLTSSVQNLQLEKRLLEEKVESLKDMNNSLKEETELYKTSLERSSIVNSQLSSQLQLTESVMNGSQLKLNDSEVNGNSHPASNDTSVKDLSRTKKLYLQKLNGSSVAIYNFDMDQAADNDGPQAPSPPSIAQPEEYEQEGKEENLEDSAASVSSNVRRSISELRIGGLIKIDADDEAPRMNLSRSNSVKKDLSISNQEKERDIETDTKKDEMTEDPLSFDGEITEDEESEGGDMVDDEEGAEEAQQVEMLKAANSATSNPSLKLPPLAPEVPPVYNSKVLANSNPHSRKTSQVSVKSSANVSKPTPEPIMNKDAPAGHSRAGSHSSIKLLDSKVSKTSIARSGSSSSIVSLSKKSGFSNHSRSASNASSSSKISLVRSPSKTDENKVAKNNINDKVLSLPSITSTNHSRSASSSSVASLKKFNSSLKTPSDDSNGSSSCSLSSQHKKSTEYVKQDTTAPTEKKITSMFPGLMVPLQTAPTTKPLSSVEKEETRGTSSSSASSSVSSSIRNSSSSSGSSSSSSSESVKVKTAKLKSGGSSTTSLTSKSGITSNTGTSGGTSTTTTTTTTKTSSGTSNTGSTSKSGLTTTSGTTSSRSGATGKTGDTTTDDEGSIIHPRRKVNRNVSFIENIETPIIEKALPPLEEKPLGKVFVVEHPVEKIAEPKPEPEEPKKSTVIDQIDEIFGVKPKSEVLVSFQQQKTSSPVTLTPTPPRIAKPSIADAQLEKRSFIDEIDAIFGKRNAPATRSGAPSTTNAQPTSAPKQLVPIVNLGNKESVPGGPSTASAEALKDPILDLYPFLK